MKYFGIKYDLGIELFKCEIENILGDPDNFFLKNIKRLIKFATNKDFKEWCDIGLLKKYLLNADQM